MSNNWETPPNLFKQLNEWWHFNLDVAASKENAKCSRYFTEEDDGLSQPWDGRVWCNPPYSEIEKWTRKAVWELLTNCKCEFIMMLLPARTEQLWWHRDVMGYAEKIYFIRRRLRFVGAKSSATFPSVLVLFRRASNFLHERGDRQTIAESYVVGN